MTILLNLLFLVLGMVLLIKGADFFVRGASAIAKRLKVPAMVIGLTVVALGTSLPELSVSIASAIKHSADLSVGNIVGSNLVNLLLILGIVTLIKPVPIKPASKKIDFPFLMGVTLLLMLFSADSVLDATPNVVSRVESIVLLVVLVIYLVLVVRNAMAERQREMAQAKVITPLSPGEAVPPAPERVLKVWQIVLCVGLGLGAVIFGAECVCSTAQYLALKMGMSEALVGLTVVAIGTSLPELATSMAAAINGENELALGNLVGSNIMNIALIVGVVGVINPVAISSVILVDMLIMCVTTVGFSVFCLTRKAQVGRVIGGILVAAYVAYLTFAIVRNYCF